MKKAVKSVIAIVLSVIILASLSLLPAFGEEAAEKKNYVTEKWVAYFDGTITETEEDGAIVTEYVPASPYSWFSPTLNLFNDLKTLIGDREGALVNISFEIQSLAEKKELVSATRVLIRAENPRTGNLAFDPGTVGDWDGNGYSWTELYKENFDSDLEFIIEAQNNYAIPENGQLEINGNDWTYYETGKIYISKADLNDDLFSGWELCFDGLNYNAESLKGLRLRNASIIDCEEKTATAVPVEPTEAPTQAPTEEPVKTDEPVNTDAPVQDKSPEAATDNSSAATPKDQDKKDDGKKSNAGLIIGIVAGAVVVAAVIAGIIAGKKKKSK